MKYNIVVFSMPKVNVLQFGREKDAMEVINGMDTNELTLKRNKLAGQYVVYPTTDKAEGVLETFVQLGGDELEIHTLDEDDIVSTEEFDGATFK